jgi:hypothetical protein
MTADTRDSRQYRREIRRLEVGGSLLRSFGLQSKRLEVGGSLLRSFGLQLKSEGQVFGGNHSEIGTNDQKRPIWPRNDRNNFLMIVEISEAVMVLDTS